MERTRGTGRTEVGNGERTGWERGADGVGNGADGWERGERGRTGGRTGASNFFPTLPLLC